MKSILTSVLLLIMFYQEIKSASILFFVMPQTSSHRRSMYPLAEALGERGHKVTFFAELAFDDGTRCKHPNVENEFASIDHDDPAFYDFWVHRNSSSFSDVQWKAHTNNPLIWNVYWKMMIDVCRITVSQKHEDLRRLVTDQKWDLIIIDGIFAPCGVFMTKWIKAPYIIFNPTCVTAWEASHRAVPYPASTVPPLGSLNNYDHKKFLHRLHAAVSYFAEYLMPFNWNYLLGKTMRQNFDQTADGPLVTWFYGNPELSFTDLPSSLEQVRPLLPDMMYTGGHCKTRQSVLNDKEWTSFVDDPSSKGTILLSFGHIVQWVRAPEEIVNNLFSAFDQLREYRIIFQYDGPPRPTKKNVKTSIWLPVVGILNHPKTKVHLTHGGVKSVTESICAKVPMVILPLFAEQMRNANSVKRIGAGETLDKLNLTQENIVKALRTVLENDRYYKRVQQLRSFTAESIRPPLATAVFWAERVLKRKSLPEGFFKHKGRHLSWIAYFNLDHITAISIFLISIFVLAVKVIMLCWNVGPKARRSE